MGHRGKALVHTSVQLFILPGYFRPDQISLHETTLYPQAIYTGSAFFSTRLIINWTILALKDMNSKLSPQDLRLIMARRRED
jgi:hypothetical protein